jgi:transposase
VAKACSDLDIDLVFSLPYRPEFNPIENTFSIVKILSRR